MDQADTVLGLRCSCSICNEKSVLTCLNFIPVYFTNVTYVTSTFTKLNQVVWLRKAIQQLTTQTTKTWDLVSLFYVFMPLRHSVFLQNVFKFSTNILLDVRMSCLDFGVQRS